MHAIKNIPKENPLDILKNWGQLMYDQLHRSHHEGLQGTTKSPCIT